MARPTYRETVGTDIWHFCTNCRHWPTEGYAWTSVAPPADRLCSECLIKERAGECT